MKHYKQCKYLGCMDLLIAFETLLRSLKVGHTKQIQ